VSPNFKLYFFETKVTVVLAFLFFYKHIMFIVPFSLLGAAVGQACKKEIVFYWRAQAGDLLGKSLYPGNWIGTAILDTEADTGSSLYSRLHR
jgi:hypothetical protein